MRHTLRKSSIGITKQAQTWESEGKRKIKRPKDRLRQKFDADIKGMNSNCNQL